MKSGCTKMMLKSRFKIIKHFPNKILDCLLWHYLSFSLSAGKKIEWIKENVVDSMMTTVSKVSVSVCVCVCVCVHARAHMHTHACVLNYVWLFRTPWTVVCQAPLSREFSRQEYWSGSPFPAPGDLPNPGIEPKSLVFPALAGGFFTTCATWEAHRC